jgi:hypothetical protein
LIRALAVVAAAAEKAWNPGFSALFPAPKLWLGIHRKDVCSERLILDARTFLWQRFAACARGNGPWRKKNAGSARTSERGSG